MDQPAPKKKEAVTAAPVVEENLYVSTLSVEEKVAIALSVGEETITAEELTALFTARPHPVVYDGFEPSGTLSSDLSFSLTSTGGSLSPLQTSSHRSLHLPIFQAACTSPRACSARST